MSYHYITFVPLDTCIGTSLDTFNSNYTSLDLNIKELSSSVESRTNYLSSALQTVSATQQTKVSFLSSQVPVISSGIMDQLNFTSIVSSGPNNTVPVVLYGKQNFSYSDIDTGIVAKGNGATLAQAPDNTVEGGYKRGGYSTDFQRKRTLPNQVALGDYSVILNGHSNLVLNSFDAIAGGFYNTVSATASSCGFIGAGSNNSVNSEYSTIICGYGNSALSAYSISIGSNNNVDKKYLSIVGNYNTTSVAVSSLGGGYADIPASTCSASNILGSFGKPYYEGHTVYSNSCFTSAGDSQYSVLICRAITNNNNVWMGPVFVPSPNIPNMVPPTSRFWNARIIITGVNTDGNVAFYDNYLTCFKNNAGGLSISPSLVNQSSNGTSLQLSTFSNILVEIEVQSSDSKTWYWTAVVEMVDISY